MRVDCTLELREDSTGQTKGSITVRLERVPGNHPSRELVDKELSQLDQIFQIRESMQVGDTNDDDTVEMLYVLLDRMRPFARVFGAASKV